VPVPYRAPCQSSSYSVCRSTHRPPARGSDMTCSRLRAVAAASIAARLRAGRFEK
jgi:hypothetical protein